MKKNELISLALIITDSVFAQHIRVYNWYFKNGSEDQLEKIFE